MYFSKVVSTTLRPSISMVLQTKAQSFRMIHGVQSLTLMSAVFVTTAMYIRLAQAKQQMLISLIVKTTQSV